MAICVSKTSCKLEPYARRSTSDDVNGLLIVAARIGSGVSVDLRRSVTERKLLDDVHVSLNPSDISPAGHSTCNIGPQESGSIDLEQPRENERTVSD